MKPAIERRLAIVHSIRKGSFDVVVIGGGINGAAIAFAAARNGLSVALFEKGDFASGTSSRSSRLIHGGVRYLEYGHIGMVFESSRERRTLYGMAPHLVRPLPFTWPVYRGARIPKWKLRAGLLAYDALSLFGNFERHRGLSRSQILQAEPNLQRDKLIGGARYFDATTDDARLTLVNVLGAQRYGALCLNHCAVTGIHAATDGTLVEAREADGSQLACRARVVVNATGPWSDDVIRMVRADRLPVVRGSKGVHIAVPRDRIGNTDAMTLLSPDDGRVLFVLPSVTTAIIGTTETHHGETPDTVRPSSEDIGYLLRVANHYFPAANLSGRDVVSAWAGIRPLAASGFQGEPGRASREHQLHWDADVLSVTGGKLTTYRVVARDVLAEIQHRLDRNARDRNEMEILPGSEFASFRGEVATAREALGSDGIASHMVESYGFLWRTVWELARTNPDLSERIEPSLPWLRAEIVYAARHEMALTIADVLMRRTHVAFELRDQGRSVAADVANLMAGELAWSESERSEKVLAYYRDADNLFGVQSAPPAL
jgi:glycerol-3-phosphate dehydrogenase